MGETERIENPDGTITLKCDVDEGRREIVEAAQTLMREKNIRGNAGKDVREPRVGGFGHRGRGIGKGLGGKLDGIYDIDFGDEKRFRELMNKCAVLGYQRAQKGDEASKRQVSAIKDFVAIACQIRSVFRDEQEKRIIEIEEMCERIEVRSEELERENKRLEAQVAMLQGMMAGRVNLSGAVPMIEDTTH